MALAERGKGEGSKENARNLLYLAAAVSDFYIPNGELPVHKIQSSEGAPSIQVTWPQTKQRDHLPVSRYFILSFQLQCVPKMLVPLAQQWKGKSALVSFKLETDSKILVAKARKALDKYGHKLVIGNLLDTRKREVGGKEFIPLRRINTKIKIKCEFQVLLVFKDEMEEVRLSDAELETGVEIEEKIISRLIEIVQQL